MDEEMRKLMADALEVSVFQYYLLPLKMILIYPLKTKEWFRQIKQTTTVDDITYRRYYLKKLKYYS